jgi:hypothetical protein
MANAKWTVMVYMAAGDDKDLDAYAVTDLQEIERARFGADVNVVVQFNRHWPNRAQRYQIKDGATHHLKADIPTGKPDAVSQVLGDGFQAVTRASGRDAELTRGIAGTDMGDMNTLYEFMDWARQDYSAQKYFLVLWGHSYGLGFGRDPEDALDMTELRQALAAFHATGTKLDLLGANACAMSYLEAAYEISEHVDFLVASQITVPFAGWPYDVILDRMKGNLDAEQLGNEILDAYASRYANGSSGERVSMSLLNLSNPTAMRDKFSSFVEALTNVVEGAYEGAGECRAQVRAAFLAAAAGDVRPLIDLHDLCNGIADVAEDMTVLQKKMVGLDDLATTAKALGDFIAPPLAKAGEVQVKPWAICRKHDDLHDLHGVGIFAPFVTDDVDLKRLELDTGRRTYAAMGLVKGTNWERLVFDTFRAPLPQPVLAGIEMSAATSRAERSAVTQMLTSIDSVFDVVDRRLKATRSRVMDLIKAHLLDEVHIRPLAAIAALGDLRLLNPGTIEKAPWLKPEGAEVAFAAGSTQTRQRASEAPPVVSRTTDAVTAFKGLEAAVATMERAICRTVTNGTFGLGPPREFEGKGAGQGAPFEGKGAGQGAPFEGKGAGQGTPFEGKGAGQGQAGDVANALGLPQNSAGAAVLQLFSRVGAALLAVEEAIGGTEATAAELLLSKYDDASTSPLLRGAAGRGRLEGGFQKAQDAVTAARRTLRNVLADPAYGFGPGPRTVGVDTRRELAQAGGLTSGKLALLA